eukprot:g31524.t1
MLDGEHSGVFHMILAAIIIGTTATIVETMPELHSYRLLFQLVDFLIAVFFSVELCVRFHVRSSVWEFFANCFNIVDILVVLPNYVEWMMLLWHLEVHNMHQAADSMRALRMTRIIRLVRLARMMRVARLLNGWSALSQMELLLKVFFEETAHGSGATSLMLLSLTSLIYACLLYVFAAGSHASSSWMASDLNLDPCEDTFAFNSIPDVWWSSVVSLTTVGFGDTVPEKLLGRLVSSLCCLSGVAALAYISAQFSMDFCQRWLRLQATHKMKETMDESLETAGIACISYGINKGSEAHDYLDELLLRFEESLKDLTDEVALAAVFAGPSSSNVMISLTRPLPTHWRCLGEVNRCAGRMRREAATGLRMRLRW